MTQLFKRPTSTIKLGAIACAAMLMVACQSNPPQGQAQAPAAKPTVNAVAAAPVLRQDAFSGIYEITTSDDGTVFVATVNGSGPKSGGLVQRLDARTLQTLQSIQLPRRAFALGLNDATNTLYVGNTLDGGLTVIDAVSGVVKGQIQLAPEKKNDKGESSYAHTRKVIVDEKHNRVFVTSPGQPGQVWIVDGATNTLTHTITSEGIWTAGAAYDEAANILYVSQGGKSEILAINPDNGQVTGSFSTGDSADNTAEASKHFFVNLTIDPQGKRLFASDGNTNQVYVADIASGKFIQTIPVAAQGILDVLYNPARNELYVTSRGVTRTEPNGSGSLTIIDAGTYKLKSTLGVPVHPNSLAVSPDGQSLYVTVKAPRGESHPAWQKDAKESVLRIDLQN